jgi:chromate transport protein ChrA
MQTADTPHAIRDLARYFLRLGTLGFGGPVALVGQMERELLGERGWRHRTNRNVQGFVKGAYAAAIGTIPGASILLGHIAIGDGLTVLIGVVSLVVLFRWRANNPLLMAAAAVIGLIAFPLLQPAWVMVR